MTWILYIIIGTSMPSLYQVHRYTDENLCKQAQRELTNRNVNAVCLLREDPKS